VLVEGHPNKEIARQLGLQEVTVKVHLKGVFRKLGATNRTQAVHIANQLGWTS
jgi:DNA-binding NarL/FixJ family response regulator